jgi:hypothetical protein
MYYLTELAVQKERCRDFHPDRKTATKGGGVPGIFTSAKHRKRRTPKVNHHASNRF